jgi:fumarylacetoacetase
MNPNNPKLKSWVEVPENSDFPIQNIPLGVISHRDKESVVATRIGDTIIDLHELQKLGYLKDLTFDDDVFSADSLNPLLTYGKQGTRDLRTAISSIFQINNDLLRDRDEHRLRVLKKAADVSMLFPLCIGDYTDFYSSREHATNVGMMFRDPKNALLPNWLHIPVGYHGRSSSIILSGQPIIRPKGQQRIDEQKPPVFGPTRLLDFELEMAFITYDGRPLGDSISTQDAEDFIFGMCLFNDWSARDIQKWEYVPLGPFLAKNFASSISPWIVTLDALEPYKTKGPKQDPEVLDYLKYQGAKNVDIHLEVCITPDKGEPNTVSRSNFKYMYWNMAQQLAHHTVNGCNVRAGDMMASGTISGPEPSSYGSMLELTWRGSKPIKLNDSTERKFIADGDTVTMTGYCDNGEVRIGFGEVTNKVLPAKE